MEEDIKILEEFIKYFEAEAVSRKYRRNISITVGEDDIEALENLIKGYRELEEKNKQCIKVLHEKDIYYQNAREFIQDNSIPKSKIKEKIEELEKEFKEFSDKYGDENDSDFIITRVLHKQRTATLQELMEDK